MHWSLLRKLMRDFKVHETYSYAYLAFHRIKFHEDVCRDITVEFLRAQDVTTAEPSQCQHLLGLPQIMCADSCNYHLHNDVSLPRCVPKRSAGSCTCAKP